MCFTVDPKRTKAMRKSMREREKAGKQIVMHKKVNINPGGRMTSPHYGMRYRVGVMMATTGGGHLTRLRDKEASAGIYGYTTLEEAIDQYGNIEVGCPHSRLIRLLVHSSDLLAVSDDGKVACFRKARVESLDDSRTCKLAVAPTGGPVAADNPADSQHPLPAV